MVTTFLGSLRLRASAAASRPSRGCVPSSVQSSGTAFLCTSKPSGIEAPFPCPAASASLFPCDCRVSVSVTVIESSWNLHKG